MGKAGRLIRMEEYADGEAAGLREGKAVGLREGKAVGIRDSLLELLQEIWRYTGSTSNPD